MKEKKKSTSSVASSNTVTTTIAGSKRTSQVGNINNNSNSSLKDHKKSQSLYNKKIVDIIQGLQQSLGVIANNVKTSYDGQTK